MTSSELFYNACKDRDLETAKKIYFTTKENYQHGFDQACINGILEVAQWYYDLDSKNSIEHNTIRNINIYGRNRDSIYYNSLFHDVCNNGHLDVAKWLYTLYKSDKINHHIGFDKINKNLYNTFKSVCTRNKLEVAQWLYLIATTNEILCYIPLYYTLMKKIILTKLDIHAENEVIFRDACCKGYLELAKWLYSLGKVDINANDEEAFRFACTNGHLETAKWLFSLDKVYIHMNDDEAFRMACSNGHLEIARWLFSLWSQSFSAHIRVDCIKAFETACLNGYFEMAKWMHSIKSHIQIYKDGLLFPNLCGIGKLDIAQFIYSIIEYKDHDIRLAFYYACKNGHLKVAKWLHSLETEVDINKSFYDACYNGYLELAKWLRSLGGVDDIDRCFYNVCEKGYLELAKWLYSTGVSNSKNNKKLFISCCEKKQYDMAKWLYYLGEINLDDFSNDEPVGVFKHNYIF